VPDTEPRPGFDVVGDVHGNHERLEGLLVALGYEYTGGAWRFPGGERQAVFVGDLIDRRPEQAQTLAVVRSMVEAGSAQVVVGNHEFNAVAYVTLDPARADYCRPHTSKNRGQHEAFLDEVGFDTPAHRSVIDWFRELPLWLDLGALRVVHACWSVDHLAHLDSLLADGTLTDDVVIGGTTKGTPTHEAIEVVLKGPEIDLDGAHYVDKDGHRRDRARSKWWDRSATTLRSTAEIPGGSTLHDADCRPIDAVPDRELEDDEVPRYTSDVPVLFGHYWRTGTPSVLGPSTACVDFSAGKGGPLVAYRWHDGDTELGDDRFVWS
jgi:hypothetical protein